MILPYSADYDSIVINFPPNAMHSKHRRRVNLLWLVISIIAVVSMVAFTILPLIVHY